MMVLDNDPQQIVLEVNGYRFDALTAGPEAGELVLFLHGFPQFAYAWVDIMRGIAGAGFRAVAVDQRGYSPGARPPLVEDYGTEYLVSDALGFADELNAASFHLVGHDWGALLAWHIAADHSDRLRSLTVLSTPHPNAFLEAVKTDDDQKQRSKYIPFFRLPDGFAESVLLADDAQRLRGAYQGKVLESVIDENVRRLAEDGALTSVLNWYRALNLDAQIGNIAVPTLYIWGEQDHAVGEAAVIATSAYVNAPYRFERLEGISHWLLEEAPDRIVTSLQEQIRNELAK